MTEVNIEQFLKPTYFIDSDTEAVRELAESLTAGLGTTAEKAAVLFYRIRDGIRYDPYSLSVDPANYRSSAVIEKGVGWCVPKAVALAGLARAVGIPSRLHFADIRNHQMTEKLLESMKTDIFYYHGYTELYVDGKWLKATPAFNIELCEKLGQQTVEFDGQSHGMLPTHTVSGERHIEYVLDRGTAGDLPLEAIFEFFKDFYSFELNDIEGPAADTGKSA